jgi:heme oxygenase
MAPLALGVLVVASSAFGREGAAVPAPGLAQSQTAGGEPPHAHMRKGEKAVAVAFAREAHAWTQELTARGETLGRMLVAVFDGEEQEADRVRAELAALDLWLASEAEYFGAKPYPNFAVMTAFRRILLDYIAWERKTLTAAFVRYLALAEDRKTARAQRWATFVAELNALNVEELAWKGKFKAAEDAVFAATNRP